MTTPRQDHRRYLRLTIATLALVVITVVVMAAFVQAATNT